jgi:hypothetical protein
MVIDPSNSALQNAKLVSRATSSEFRRWISTFDYLPVAESLILTLIP